MSTAHNPKPSRPANRLAGSTSPYLLQHAHNPVDWYPWGPEALARAAAEDKPIFLSIGYSACHWCHVMERESFEDEAIADMLNAHFVSVKVDREERPDLDEIYMDFVQAFTGSGGWPMSTFLTPNGRPFFGGTYWPPRPSRGMPGFMQVLQAIRRMWTEQRSAVLQQAGQAVDFLREHTTVAADDSPDGADPAADPSAHKELLTAELVRRATTAISRGFDGVNGGFGHAPKFPHSMELSLLLRQHAAGGDAEPRQMVELALHKMARGGIYDQLAGGFARYSVDARWAVPHFEKMLYDNALLTRTYLEAHQLTGEAFLADIARESFDWVLAEMTAADGGIYSTLDADSEGEEGKFYVWTPRQLEAVLGPELGTLAARYYDVTEQGNFEDHSAGGHCTTHGSSTLTVPKTLTQLAAVLDESPESLRGKLDEIRRRLLAARAQRVRPGTDTKILTAWNGLMIASLARGAQVLAEPRYRVAAERAVDFLLSRMTTSEGRLLRTSRDGHAHLTAYVEDYACVIEGLLDLYEAGFEAPRLRQALGLAEHMMRHHFDAAEGGFFFTADDAESLIVRSKNYADNATPSGNSVAVSALLRLAALTGRADLATAAERTLRLFAPLMAERPFAFANMLCAVDQYLADGQEIAIVGSLSDPVVQAGLAEIRRRFARSRVVAHKPTELSAEAAAELEKLVPLLAGRTAVEGRASFYVCRNSVCARPVHTVAELAALLDGKPKS